MKRISTLSEEYIAAQKAKNHAMSEAIQVEADMMTCGIGIMKDGKRIDPWDFYIDVSKVEKEQD